MMRAMAVGRSVSPALPLVCSLLLGCSREGARMESSLANEPSGSLVSTTAAAQARPAALDAAAVRRLAAAQAVLEVAKGAARKP
jgi:hypothetical protein